MLVEELLAALCEAVPIGAQVIELGALQRSQLPATVEARIQAIEGADALRYTRLFSAELVFPLLPGKQPVTLRDQVPVGGVFDARAAQR